MKKFFVIGLGVLFLVVAGIGTVLAADLSAFKTHALYRAVKVNFKVTTVKGTVQIMRADDGEKGTYNEVGTVALTGKKGLQEFTDTSMGGESAFYYKIVLKETGETLGPMVARPYFSPPST